MDIFKRLFNLLSGVLSLFVSGVEQDNPEAVYEAAINSRIETHGRLKKAVAGIVHLRNKLQKEYDEAQAELSEVVPQLNVAVEQGQDDLALVLLQRKEQLEKKMAGHEGELAKVSQQAEDAKASLVAFQGEIEKLKNEKDQMLAKKANAEARIQIENTLSGISVEPDIKALDGVRTSIDKLHAEADVSSEINGSSFDARMKKIKEQTGTATAKAKLEEMKKKLATSKLELITGNTQHTAPTDTVTTKTM